MLNKRPESTTEVLSNILIMGAISVGFLTYLLVPLIAYVWENWIGLGFNATIAPALCLALFGLIYYLSFPKLVLLTKLSYRYLTMRNILLIIIAESTVYFIASLLIPAHGQYLHIFS